MKIGNKDTLRENKCIFFRYLNNRRERIEHSISLRSKQKLNHSKYLFYEKFKFTNNFNALQSPPPPSLINLKTSNRNTSVSNCKKNPLDKNHLSTHLKTETISKRSSRTPCITSLPSPAPSLSFNLLFPPSSYSPREQ